jgi:hypothetical protein
LNDRHLPDALVTPSLLNPLFGNKTRMVESGLMSKGQYFKARQNLLQKMQDILDKNNPLLCYTLSDNSSSEGSSNDKDDDIPRHNNMNHSKAKKEELEEFEYFKSKKYHPKVREVTARCLTGESCQIMVGPVDQKGKIFPQDIIFLTTWMFEVVLILSNSLVIIASCFQPFG